MLKKTRGGGALVSQLNVKLNKNRASRGPEDSEDPRVPALPRNETEYTRSAA